MPVIGTPVITPDPPAPPVECTPTLTECTDLNKISPEVSSYYSKLVLTRMRSVRIRCGQHAEIHWTMVDNNGFPVDLTECGFPDAGSSESLSSYSASSYSSLSSAAVEEGGVGFKFRIRENLSLGIDPQPVKVEYPVHLVDASQGKVKIVLDKKSTGVPGVYFAELGIFDNFGVEDTEMMLFSNVFYVLMERGQFGSHRHMQGGPPTIMEVRLHLRDSAPEESLLLDNIKFDDAEIALAISRPIQYWNEIPPDLGVRATTQNFPFRYHWLEGICANLFFMAAENFRANNLTYSAAGVQVNDQNKEPNYLQAAQRRNAEWQTFVRRKKSELNLNAAWGEVGSSYRYAYNYGGRLYY
jgi:hypothetical protein